MKNVWLLLSVILIIIGVYVLYDFENNQNYNLKIGDTFHIKIPVNGSTGYSNCWINQTKCNNVKLISENYHSSFSEIFGFKGSESTVSLTFEAIQNGMDTIKIASCPTGIEGKNCNEFYDDSINVEHQFIVKIK